jgi:myosin heavy subunit
MESLIKEFTYLKENGEVKKYKVLQMKDYKEAIEGISLLDFKEEEQDKILKIYQEFLTNIKPYMIKYRKFNKAGIKG